MFRAVIPARYSSTRLPGKPLQMLAGRPMLEWVWRIARASAASEVIIATDDSRIAQVAQSFGADVAMTALEHPSGTARIAEVAAQRRWSPQSIVVNVQGDEPLLPPALIDQVAHALSQDPGADLATLATPLRDRSQFLDPSAVKLVMDVAGYALYFSRAPIPWPRDAASDSPPPVSARRHVGLYAYRVAALERLAQSGAAAAAELENIEKLEQLRALALGMRIRVADAAVLPGPDVNTAEDIAAVEVLLKR